jgi:hypothetical protein
VVFQQKKKIIGVTNVRKQVNVQNNWEIWQKIEGYIKKWVTRRWNHDERDDVLSAGMELFVRRNRGDYGLLEHLRFGKLCCKQGARGLRAWTNRREYADGGEAADVVIATGAAAVDQNLLVSQIIDIINKSCCEELREITKLIVSGEVDSLREASQLAGISESAASRHFRTLGRLLCGRVRITSTRLQKNTQQLQLFAL